MNEEVATIKLELRSMICQIPVASPAEHKIPTLKLFHTSDLQPHGSLIQPFMAAFAAYSTSFPRRTVLACSVPCECVVSYCPSKVSHKDSVRVLMEDFRLLVTSTTWE